jgi:hypothetical protein
MTGGVPQAAGEELAAASRAADPFVGQGIFGQHLDGPDQRSTGVGEVTGRPKRTARWSQRCLQRELPSARPR